MILTLLACLNDFPDRHADFDGDGIGADEDCDDTDPKIGVVVWYIDADGDGQGGAQTVEKCEPPKNGVALGGDCDDEHAYNFVGNAEVCDQLDNNCNGEIDDITQSSAGAHFGYPDADGDSYGDELAKEQSASCDPRVQNQDDCDDTNHEVNPGAEEVCSDGLDTDCDGSCDDCCFGDGKKNDNNVRDAAFTLLSRDANIQVGPTLVTGDLFAEGAVAFAAGSTDGTVYAVPNAVLGLAKSGQVEIDVVDPFDRKTIAVLRGPSADDAFGAAMATLETASGVDLLVGAPGAEELVGSATTEGAVYLLPGPLSAGTDLGVEASDIAFYAGGLSTAFGSTLVTGFDFDGDKRSDVVVSGTALALDKTAAYQTGAVWVFYDPPSVPTSSSNMILGSEQSDGFGTTLAAGDVDGDGTSDLLVGRTSSTIPEVCVFFGGLRVGTMSSDDVDLSFVSFTHAANLGSAIALGDFDGDGELDVAAGASQPGETGALNATVRVFLNNGEFKSADAISLDSNDLTFVGTEFDRTGTALVARDFDNDPVDDLLIGSPDVAGGGLTYLLRMPQTGGVGPNDESAQWSISLGDADLGERLDAAAFDPWPDVLLAAPGVRSVYLWKSAGIQ